MENISENQPQNISKEEKPTTETILEDKKEEIESVQNIEETQAKAVDEHKVDKFTLKATQMIDCENFDEKAKKMKGTPAKLMNGMLVVVGYLWMLIPVILLVLYFFCTYVIDRYFYYTVWSVPERIFWYWIMLHLTYYEMIWSLFKCHFAVPVLFDMGYPRIEAYDADTYCESCKHEKYTRTHHCGFCKKCILKYDHHCAWMSNCIGYHNAHYFFKFMLACFQGVLICDIHLYYVWKFYYGTELFPFWIVLFMTLFFANITLVMMFQIASISFCFSTNLTIMESVVYISNVFRQKTLKIPLPFTKGFLNNWHEALHVPNDLPLFLGFLPFDLPQGKAPEPIKKD
ncbi:palmitoyltransferase ZDHHC15, putative [Entamoeba invadens IP1]|uniref:Palmitoyltransferase n=2 Tax=Entamoeba invadens TaxID=33085 RepID=A0A0A1U541_ENTIV|nr:palmitoyltransferase ZDHHC15, putative [Entamoeba invadens IP1]ELP86856.1 palmitoyltransferase ZDHHC15, putative [Entamoeba invadens IP1]BAN41304.1 palmitoyltransferase ZDHHC15, putative [Entamoeba invadens]|eukprot:XP_004253627.1 palmitoyltransferase ZDHHC15, putative [Entamoeba invadens IP1]